MPPSPMEAFKLLDDGTKNLPNRTYRMRCWYLVNIAVNGYILYSIEVSLCAHVITLIRAVEEEEEQPMIKFQYSMESINAYNNIIIISQSVSLLLCCSIGDYDDDICIW